MEAVVRLNGAVELGLERLVDLGYFRTRSEAIRAAILKLISEFHALESPSEVEQVLLERKLKSEEAQMRKAGTKYLSKEKALAKYR